jgi:hypothetical protein
MRISWAEVDEAFLEKQGICLIILSKVRASYFVAWEWASTNHNHLSIPREISVNRSAVSASSSSPASLIVLRAPAASGHRQSYLALLIFTAFVNGL